MHTGLAEILYRWLFGNGTFQVTYARLCVCCLELAHLKPIGTVWTLSKISWCMHPSCIPVDLVLSKIFGQTFNIWKKIFKSFLHTKSFKQLMHESTRFFCKTHNVLVSVLKRDQPSVLQFNHLPREIWRKCALNLFDWYVISAWFHSVCKLGVLKVTSQAFKIETLFKQKFFTENTGLEPRECNCNCRHDKRVP